MSSSSTTEALRQCTVVSIDDTSMVVTAFYNPNKIRISKSVPWQGHASAHSHAEVLEFTGAKNQTLAVDLFFDNHDVSEQIQTLVDMTEATILVSAREKAMQSEARREASSGGGAVSSTNGARDRNNDGKAMRPHFVMLVWGDMPPFKGVISSLDTEYTRFLPSGLPVRATCALKMTELHITQMVSVNPDDALRYREERVRYRSI